MFWLFLCGVTSQVGSHLSMINAATANVGVQVISDEQNLESLDILWFKNYTWIWSDAWKCIGRYFSCFNIIVFKMKMLQGGIAIFFSIADLFWKNIPEEKQMLQVINGPSSIQALSFRS